MRDHDTKRNTTTPRRSRTEKWGPGKATIMGIVTYEERRAVRAECAKDERAVASLIRELLVKWLDERGVKP